MQNPALSMDAGDLEESDWKLLEELRRGRATPKALTDWTGLSESTIHSHLKHLRWAGYVEKVHESGLYELVLDPREDDE
jgi:DNA-binding IclR family transcriptional regulator